MTHKSRFQTALRCYVNCNVYTAECCVMYVALQYINNVNNSNFLNFLYSLNVFLALKYTHFKFSYSYILYNIKKFLYLYYQKGINVILSQVQSHSRITENEVVNKATRQGHNEDLSSSFEAPFTDFHCLLSSVHDRVYREYWTVISKDKCSWYKEIQGVPPAQP